VTVTPTSFVALFPEFQPVHEQYSTLVAATLAQVEERVSDSWGDERDEVVGLECAASIAAGPLGRAAQLQAKEGTTTYTKRLQAMREAHGCVHELRVV
jgi:hypothetical protein